MPPKPKGLKASKRAAPFDPSAVDSEPSSSTSASASGSASTSNPDRTYPLDEDCLTISDLFELRYSVLEILYPFPTCLTLAQTPIDPSRLDEARSLLRGILHGSAVLEQFVKQGDYGRVVERDQDGVRADDKVAQRIEEAGRDKLGALGLTDDFAEAFILYLQGWALHHLGEIFVDPKLEIQSAALKLSGSGGGPSKKKRKIDLNEPSSKREWLEAAWFKYRLVWEGVMKEGKAAATKADGRKLCVALFAAGYEACRVSLAKEYANFAEKAQGGDESQACEKTGKDLVRTAANGLFASVEDGWGIGTTDEPNTIDDTDAVLAQLRAWAEWVSFVDTTSRFVAGDAVEALEKVRSALTSDSLQGKLVDAAKVEGKEAESAALWKWLNHVVVADAEMVQFVLTEDRVEAEFRPEGDDDEAGEEDEEAEVKELPMDAELVQLAKEKSKQAIRALRQTIESFANLPSSVAHPSGKDAQYRKLEETLLISSALVNPSDVEGTKQVEAEIERVRKEAGLEQEGEEGEEEDDEDENDEA
ncbi:hypothetical protein JCM10212_001522 [Sporobolomyces blumeae]